MRYLSLIIIVVFISCNKDKFTTVPQLSYKSTSPNSYKKGTLSTSGIPLPQINFEVTDSEGDVGLIPGKDSSYTYIKNLNNNYLDSVLFPNITTITQKKFEALVQVLINKDSLQFGKNSTKKDTIFYEVYIKDFAKNKSNVIKCGPMYYTP